MARDYYETTIALPDAAAGNAMKPLASVKVYVVPRGTLDADVPTVVSSTPIYQSHTGAAQGPDPKSGATGTNPLTTGASGSVRFWADGPAEFDLVFEDTIIPARITDRVGWNCVPAKAGSLSTSILASDGGIKQAMLSAEVIMQQEPIGGITDWWRPVQAVALPAGFEVADGRSLASGQHEFPGVAGAVTLPNLQNVFILGASVGKNDGTGAGADNTPGGGPGIRGTGGSNVARNLAHGHNVPIPDHYHLVNVPQHYHNADGGLTTGGHSHGVSVSGYSGAANRGTAGTPGGGQGGEGLAYTNHGHGMSSSGGTDSAGNLGVYGNTGYVAAPQGGNTSYSSAVGPGFPGTGVTSSTTWTADPGTEFRPYFIGLLRLIKVRRTA